MVSVTPLGDILLSIKNGKECEELYRYYLHDFVFTVHKCSHRMKENIDNEYKVRIKNTHLHS